MTVDPTDPETFDDTFRETLDAEAPEADAAEQQTDLTPQHDDELTSGVPFNANEADLAEQARVVELNEDEYR